jgi:hypothetical protein
MSVGREDWPPPSFVPPYWWNTSSYSIGHIVHTVPANEPDDFVMTDTSGTQWVRKSAHDRIVDELCKRLKST